ncbi:MAG: S8 family serine peptidase, partial [Deltaproteobacteria bacterium]
DERQDQIIAGNLTNGAAPSGPGYLAWLASKGFTQAQFDESGFVVDLSDSGIDNGTTQPGHFALYSSGNTNHPSRVQYNRLEGKANTWHHTSSIAGCDGHGNLNAHIVAGYVDPPAEFPHVDAAGYAYGLGVCPFVRVGSSVVFDPDFSTNPNSTTLISGAYADGARISNNSWGNDSSSDGQYDIDAQTFDALVRDAQPAGSPHPATGNQEMVIVFSAGNDGPGANTITSPGTAKNVITVGAAANVRSLNLAHGGNDAGGGDGCDTVDAEAEDANDLLSFTSQGPCNDGRIKPDLVAPGTHESLEFGPMIHQIHRGANMPSVRATPSVPLILNGTNFSDVGYPQDLRNCTKCHNETATDAPDAARFATRPTTAICSSCHNNMYFGTAATPPLAYQIAHPAGPATDAECAGCHRETGGSAASPTGIRTAHVSMENRPGAPTVAFAITGVTNNLAGSAPVVNFTVNDRAGAQVPALPTNSAVTFTGTGTATMSVTGIASAIQGLARPYTVRVRVVAGGARGVFTFVYSFDNGTTEIGVAPTPLPTTVPAVPTPILSTAAAYALKGPVLLPTTAGFATSLPASNLSLWFSATGTAVAGDTYTFTAGTLPLTTVAATGSPNTIQSAANGFISSLGFYMNGPAEMDYAATVAPSTTATAITGTQGTLVALATPGSYSLAFPPTAIIPATATGTWAIAMQAARFEYIGTSGIRTTATSASHSNLQPVSYFPVVAGGTAVPRDRPVEVANCNVCHDRLTLHGTRRNTEFCVFCHNPNLIAAVPGAPAGTTQSLVLRRFIHRIHMGANLPSVVAGGTFAVGSSVFSDIQFPRPITNCNACHTAPGSYSETSAQVCTSCHDAPATVAHAQLSTTAAGVEACDACHGPGRAYDVTAVHSLVP